METEFDKLDSCKTTGYITITKGIAGYFAVHVWWNPEGFWEPYDTGFGRYASKEAAEIEGVDWANMEQIPFLRG